MDLDIALDLSQWFDVLWYQRRVKRRLLPASLHLCSWWELVGLPVWFLSSQHVCLCLLSSSVCTETETKTSRLCGRMWGACQLMFYLTDRCVRVRVSSQTCIAGPAAGAHQSMLSLLTWPSGPDYPTSVWVVEDQSGNNQSASPQLATKEVAWLRQYEYPLNHLIPCGDTAEQSLFSRDLCRWIKGLEQVTCWRVWQK